MFGLKNDEILTYFLLIVVGYYIAKMFSRRCNGFSVGGEILNHFPSDENSPGCDTTALFEKRFKCDELINQNNELNECDDMKDHYEYDKKKILNLEAKNKGKIDCSVFNASKTQCEKYGCKYYPGYQENNCVPKNRYVTCPNVAGKNSKDETWNMGDCYFLSPSINSDVCSSDSECPGCQVCRGQHPTCRDINGGNETNCPV